MVEKSIHKYKIKPGLYFNILFTLLIGAFVGFLLSFSVFSFKQSLFEEQDTAEYNVKILCEAGFPRTASDEVLDSDFGSISDTDTDDGISASSEATQAAVACI